MTIRQTEQYDKWFRRLRDRNVKARIDIRIKRLSQGNAGDVRSVGSGISELRINYGPGYRVYYQQRGETYILLLIGGDKSTQDRDIELAKKLADEMD